MLKKALLLVLVFGYCAVAFLPFKALLGDRIWLNQTRQDCYAILARSFDSEMEAIGFAGAQRNQSRRFLASYPQKIDENNLYLALAILLPSISLIGITSVVWRLRNRRRSSQVEMNTKF